MISKFIGVTALAITLAACGTNTADRTGGGAAAGAATGAGIGALGGPGGALAGAAIGGGAGAATGAATSPDQVNLGTPPWSNPETRVPGRRQASGGGVAAAGPGGREAAAWAGGSTDPAEVREAQRQLQQRGYNVGPVDGIYGPRTRDAVAEFQRYNNIDQTSRLDANTMQLLTSRGGPSPSMMDGTGSPGGSMQPGTGSGPSERMQPGMGSGPSERMPPR
jgi:hypothetical protein